MTIQIIGAGFGRTGTSSLKQALEDLGFGPCYHMTELMTHPDHAPLWVNALDGSEVWDEVFAEYRATVDWPGAALYERLMERYPDARVILTVRDPERWYQSAHDTIYAIHRLTSRPPVAWLLSWVAPQQRRTAIMIDRMVWEHVFDGRFADPQYAMEVFTRSNAEVQRHVPAERLLVFDVREGWEPLCRFLGVPVPPDQPFPHLNDTAQFRRLIHLVRALAFGLPVVCATTGLALLWRIARHRRTAA